MNSNLPKVAVVILCWNGKRFLEEFIPPLLKTTYPNAELYVADNKSTDDSVAYLQANFPRVKIIQIEKNEGFAKGYNIALQQVEADYYVLLNQDVEVTPGWIEPMIEMVERDTNIGIAQPKLKAQTEKEYFEYAGAAGGYIDYLGYPFCRGRLFDSLEKDEGQYDTEEEIFWASGASLFIRSELYHQAGGLDADFFAHMEEIDLCWRVKNMGYSIRYCPDSLVYHVGGGSLPQGNPRKTYLNFRNNLSMMMKNLPENRFWHVIIIRFLLDIIAAYVSLLKGNPKDYWAVVRAHFYFVSNMGALMKKRKATKLLTGGNSSAIKGKYNNSIVADYFLRSKKYFSDLEKKDFD